MLISGKKRQNTSVEGLSEVPSSMHNRTSAIKPPEPWENWGIQSGDKAGSQGCCSGAKGCKAFQGQRCVGSSSRAEMSVCIVLLIWVLLEKKASWRMLLSRLTWAIYSFVDPGPCSDSPDSKVLQDLNPITDLATKQPRSKAYFLLQWALVRTRAISCLCGGTELWRNIQHVCFG